MLKDTNFQQLMDEAAMALRQQLADRPDNAQMYDWALQQFRLEMGSFGVDTFSEDQVDAIAASLLCTFSLMARYLMALENTETFEPIRRFIADCWAAQKMMLRGLYDGLDLGNLPTETVA